MSIEEVSVNSKKERSKTHHGSPRKPEVTIDIIEWRDKQLKTWQYIGDRLDMTRAGVRHLYHKWYPWSVTSKRKTRLR
jgi:hypothetical protein